MSDMRGFKSTNEMDASIIEIWNNIIHTGDEVYHLGDFGFGKEKEISKYRSQLNGKVNLILGNHDYKNSIDKLGKLFTSVSDLKTIKYNHERIILCHYAMRVWSASHHNSYHLFGHSHGLLNTYGKSFDIGWDVWGKPLNISEVIDEFNKLPDNFNFIKEEE